MLRKRMLSLFVLFVFITQLGFDSLLFASNDSRIIEHKSIVNSEIEFNRNLEPFGILDSSIERDYNIRVLRQVQDSRTYPLAVKIYMGLDDNDDPIYEDKVFANADETLGFANIFAGRSNWTYKTYKKVFYGWTLENTSSKANKGDDKVPAGTKIYRDFETIGSISEIQEGSILYPIATSEGGLIALAALLSDSQNTGALNISRYNEAEEVLLGSTVKDSETQWTSQDINNPTGEVDIVRELTAYYDQEKDLYKFQSISDFTYDDLRVPFTVIENPLGTIKAATDVTDFSGEKPLNYSFEDLIVRLDPRTSVADLQENWTFSSSTFMVAAVLDENYSPLPMTSLIQPGHDELISSFSFDNSSNSNPHTFIIRTIVRNDVGNGTYTNDRGASNNILSASGADVASPMTLYSGEPNNISITREVARDLALSKNKSDRLDYHGGIKGSMSFNKSQYPFPLNMFVPNNADIAYTDARNHVYVDFTPAMVKFDKNTVDLNDTDEQNKGYSIFALNGSLDSDDFAENIQPNTDPSMAGQAFLDEFDVNDELEIDGKYYYFKGWNTKADGSGQFVDGSTKITLDMFNSPETEAADLILYGIWHQLDIAVSKVWDDNENILDRRPDSITVKLIGDDGGLVEAELNESNGWKYIFEAVRQFSDSKNEIIYSVDEESVDNYIKSIDLVGKVDSEDSLNRSVKEFVLVNKFESVDIPVSKIWEDADNQDGKRPTEITVKLLAGGNDTGKTLVLNSDNEWKGNFTNLDKFAEGEEIVYTIEELEVTGYTSAITGNVEEGFVITNNYVLKDPTNPIESETTSTEQEVDSTNESNVPSETTKSTDEISKTGENILNSLIITIFVVLGFVTLVILRKKILVEENICDRR